MSLEDKGAKMQRAGSQMIQMGVSIIVILFMLFIVAVIIASVV